MKAKEILEYLKNGFYVYDETYIEEKCKILTKKENHQLLNYITNLQNKNKKLKKEIQRQSKALCINDKLLVNYRDRINKAIDYLEQPPVIEINGEFRNIYSEDDDKLLKILKGE